MSLSDLVGRVGAGVLRRLDPETAHGVAIRGLKSGAVPPRRGPADPRLAVNVLGLAFPNPIGMAAGFDKNGEVVDAVLALGFGFVEIGSVTPRPQVGNPKPRIFRLPEVEGVINRLGFNNDGHDAVAARLAARRGRPGIVGINVGANKDAADRAADYVAGIRRFHADASYITVNVSSPNTPGLRDLQARAALDELLARSVEARDEIAARTGRRVPLVLKIAPDLTEEGLDDIASVVQARGADGLVISNTTISRAGLAHPVAKETGGLSGRPVFERSTIVLAKMRQRVGPGLTLMGAGGVGRGRDAIAKLEAGANLIQLYTGFIYAGSGLPSAILTDLSAKLDAERLGSISDIVGRRTAEWAARSIPA